MGSILYRLYLLQLLTIDDHNPHFIWAWGLEWSLVYQMGSCTENEMTTYPATIYIYIYIYVEGCFIRNINFTGKTRPYFSEVLIEFISDIFSTTHIFPIIQKVSWKFDFWFLFIHNIFKSVPPFPDISFSKPMGIMLYFRSPNTLSEIAVVYL